MTIVVPCNENMYAYPLRPGYNWTWGDGTSWNTPPMDGNADSAYLGDGRCRFTVLG